MAAEPNNWSWKDYVQFLLDLHDDILIIVTEYWDNNDLLNLEQLDSKQQLKTLISDAFKRLKLVKLNDQFSEAIEVLMRCGEGLKIVECGSYPRQSCVQCPISIWAEILARQSPNIVEFKREYMHELDRKKELKLIINYISQLQGRCKLRTVRIDYGYERSSKLAEMENEMLIGCDSIEDIYLNTYNSKAVANVQKYLEKHGDRVKKLEIFTQSAIAVAAQLSSYLRSGCRLIVKQYSYSFLVHDWPTLSQHLSILQNRTDLDCYVHIKICKDPDALPFDIIKSIEWDKKWDYQKLAASKGIETFRPDYCDKDLFIFLTNPNNLPKLNRLTVNGRASNEFRTFLKARGHWIKLSGWIKSKDHIEDLTAISNHLKLSDNLYIILAVNENQDEYEISLELLKKLASSSNRRIILQFYEQELFDRYEQLYSMLTKQAQAVLQLDKSLF